MKMAVMVVVVAVLAVVVSAEGRALLGIGELIDHLKPDCRSPPSDGEVPGPYSEPSSEDTTPLSPAPEPSPEYELPPPYSASPSPVDHASRTSPASYQTPPAPAGGY